MLSGRKECIGIGIGIGIGITCSVSVLIVMVYHLSNNDKITLKNYSYNGYDASLTYKYILSPFAQWCVDKFIPLWMAPNVVTLLGLIGKLY